MRRDLDRAPRGSIERGTVHIAIDGGTWTNARGYGRFTRELLAAAAAIESKHRFTVVVDDTAIVPEVHPRLQFVRAALSMSPSEAASATGRRTIADMRRMSRALAAQHADCVFFPSVYTYVPVATRAPVVVCIHDCIPELYPEHVFATRRARLFWTLKTRAAVRQAAKIVTVSEHARAGIAKEFGVETRSIAVVPEAPAAAFRVDADPQLGRRVLLDLGLPDEAPFLMCVGGIAPHKNLGMLIDCVGALRRAAMPELALILVGDYTHDVFYSAYPELRRQAERTGGVFFTGSLADETVAGLMRITRALVLPSLDEGFGLPGIEAAACGAAVVATRNSALPDVLGDAARYFDPRDEDALRGDLEELLTNDTLRSSLGSKAAIRAAQLTWTKAAERLLAVFGDIASENA